jgi:Fibronectin type III domain
VLFSPPPDDGGDTITGYLVEWSIYGTFTPASATKSATVTQLAGGAPFQKVIQNLVNGQPYYIRVSARNSLGYGQIQTSSPAFQHPYNEPSEPLGVVLAVTSDSLLTVSFAPPASNGGDPVTGYRVTWDVMPTFTSLTGSPHQGSADVAGGAASSLTLTDLTAGRMYYVKVAAANGASVGSAAKASPAGAAPLQQRPGKPVNAAVVTAGAHQLQVSWLYPRIPKHGIPCGGSLAAPAVCPTPPGGNVGSDGGAAIVRYQVQWDTNPAFSGPSVGIAPAPALSYTISGLTTGLAYYVRVVAVNSVGIGDYCSRTGNTCSAADPPLVMTAL